MAMMSELRGTSGTNDAALLQQRSERVERNRRLESIKMQRRRVRREKWLQGLKSVANHFAPGVETANRKAAGERKLKDGN